MLTDREALNVLVVEDDPGYRTLVEEWMREAELVSLTLDTCGGLGEAARKLPEGQYDVLLLDLGLPESSGIQTFDEVRSWETGLPVVVFTAEQDESQAIKAVQTGAQDYLIKGEVDGKLLVRSLLYATERHKLSRRWEMEADILKRLDQRTVDRGTLEEVLGRVRKYLDVEAAGLRLEGDNGWPFLVRVGYPSEFAENNCLLSPAESGKSEGPLPCLCGAALQEDTSISVAFSTDSGSLYLDEAGQYFGKKTPSEETRPKRDRCPKSGFRSVAVLPLRVQEKTRGLLHIGDSSPGALSEDSLSFLETVADSIAMGLARQEAEDSARRRNEVLACMRKIDQAILAADSVSMASNVAATGVGSLLQTACTCIFQWDQDREMALLRGHHTVSSPESAPVQERLSLSEVPPASRLRDGESVQVTDLRELNRAARLDEMWRENGIRSKATVPIFAGESLLGWVSVGWEDTGSLSTEDQEILEMVAEVLGIAFINFMGQEKREQLKRELVRKKGQLQKAGRISEQLYPTNMPTIKDFDVGAACDSAGEVGGDYYDFFPLAEGTTGVVVADAMGHDLSAALVMASMRAYLHSAVQKARGIREVMLETNTHLAETSFPDVLFCTMILLQLDPHSRSVQWINAGHPAAYIVNTSRKTAIPLESSVPPLGVLPEADIPAVDKLSLRSGDVLVLMTDGIVDARSPDGEAYGPNRTLEVVQQEDGNPAQEIAEAVCDDVRRHCQPHGHGDDITCVVIRAD